MIILDTNVVSEVIKLGCDPFVSSWFRAQDPSTLYVTTITEAELLFGIECLPAGRRRANLFTLIERLLGEHFAGRILGFDSISARNHARIAAARRASGRPIAFADCQIAGIARSRSASVASRNAAGFEGCGIEIVNPWEGR